MGSLIWWLWACGPSTPDQHLAAARAAEDEADAAIHLDAACRGGLVEACLERGRNGAGDPDARRAAVELACEAGEAAGCALRSEAPGDRWDQKACEARSAEACVRCAAATTDPRDRARFDAQACHEGAISRCLPAADAWRALGDRTRAAALYGVRCQGGLATACALQQAVRAEEKDLAACAADPAACLAPCLGGQLEACREELLAPRCHDGEAVACTRRAQLRLAQGDPAVEDLLWQACDQVDPWACLLLADRLEAGRPRPESARGDAPWLREQACDLQLDYACP